jgi:hypothetical protein
MTITTKVAWRFANRVCITACAAIISFVAAADGQLIQTIKKPSEALNFVSGATTILTIDGKIIVGAPYGHLDSRHEPTGALFVLDAVSGALLNTIANPHDQDNTFFGAAIAKVDGGVLVGSPGDQSNDGIVDAGRAFIVDIDSGEIVQTFNNPRRYPFVKFGTSVASSSTGFAISEVFGVLSIYSANGTAPKQISNPVNLAGGTIIGDVYSFGANFGASVYNQSGQDERAIVLNPVTGELLHTYFNPGPPNTNFGAKMVLAGNRAAISAVGFDAGAPYSGAVYIVDATTNVLLATIPNPNPTELGLFGNSMERIGDNLLLVGGVRTNAAFLYDIRNGQLLHTYHDPDPLESGFGSMLGTIGNDILIGADVTIYRFAVVPEPSSISMIAIATTLLCAWRALPSRAI